MKWISVKDAVPQDDREVLTYHSGDGVSGPYYCVDWYNARRETFVEAHSQQGEVIAWAEISGPPSEMVELTKTPTNNRSHAICPKCKSERVLKRHIGHGYVAIASLDGSNRANSRRVRRPVVQKF